MLTQFVAVVNAEIPCLLKCNLPRALKKEESDLYVSYCPVLDLYSQGGTEKKQKIILLRRWTLYSNGL